MLCPKCGFGNSKSAKRCKECDADLTQAISRSVPQMGRVDEKQLRRESALRTAQYECRRYRLESQSAGESDWQFIDRIEREKTLGVIAELAQMRKPMQPIREAGEDG